MQYTPRRDRATRILRYVGVDDRQRPPHRARQAQAADVGAVASSRAPPPRARGSRRPPGTKQILEQRGPERHREAAARGPARALHRHHLARRAPVAAGDAAAHLRHRARRARDRAPGRRPLLAGDVGRRDLRRRLPLPVGGSVAAPGGAAPAGPERDVPDAGARRQRRRLHQLPRRRRRRRSSRRRPPPAWTCSGSSTRSTTSTTCRSRSRRRRRPAASSRRPSATRATSPIRARTKYDLKYYVDLAKEIVRARHAPAGDQGHGRACSSRAPRRCWSRR